MKKIYHISKREESEEDRVHARIRRAFERGRLNRFVYEERDVQYVAEELSSSNLRIKPGDISVFFKINGIAESWGSYVIDLRACAKAKERPIVSWSKTGGCHANHRQKERFGACLDRYRIPSDFGSFTKTPVQD